MSVKYPGFVSALCPQCIHAVRSFSLISPSTHTSPLPLGTTHHTTLYTTAPPSAPTTALKVQAQGPLGLPLNSTQAPQIISNPRALASVSVDSVHGSLVYGSLRVKWNWLVTPAPASTETVEVCLVDAMDRNALEGAQCRTVSASARELTLSTAVHPGALQVNPGASIPVLARMRYTGTTVAPYMATTFSNVTSLTLPTIRIHRSFNVLSLDHPTRFELSWTPAGHLIPAAERTLTVTVQNHATGLRHVLLRNASLPASSAGSTQITLEADTTYPRSTSALMVLHFGLGPHGQYYIYDTLPYTMCYPGSTRAYVGSYKDYHHPGGEISTLWEYHYDCLPLTANLTLISQGGQHPNVSVLIALRTRTWIGNLPGDLPQGHWAFAWAGVNYPSYHAVTGWFEVRPRTLPPTAIGAWVVAPILAALVVIGVSAGIVGLLVWRAKTRRARENREDGMYHRMESFNVA
eukprot:gnl/Trimastix_PCT/1066.p1 GENE.gnl/Trimastix_PCT/1066~~gnl/Trimastix_PCT/1066.p1  ORF type:complete len:463 (-),score=2.51 gnl/Trimastix_PCT/1066:122-1510(-)